MKKILSSLALVLITISAYTQHTAHYNRSVFSGMSYQMPADAGTISRLQLPSLQPVLPGWMGHRDKVTGQYRDLHGPAMDIPGNTFHEKAAYCMERLLPSLGLQPEHWRQTGVREAPHAVYAEYEQYFAGHRVAFSGLTLRFTKEGKLLRIRNYSYGVADRSRIPVPPAAAELAAAVADIGSMSIAEAITEPEWVWFPVPAEVGGYDLRPSWYFRVSGSLEDGREAHFTGYVDAISGVLLYRDDEVKEQFDMKVKGRVRAQTPSDPLTDEPLAHLRITIGGTEYYTDTSGAIDIASRNPPVTASVSLQGRWARVRAGLANNNTPSFSYNAAANGTIYTFDTSAPSGTRHVNAYYHVTRIHDFMKKYFTDFTTLDVPVTTNVDVSGTCNAFYNGGNNSLNFYQAGNGCNSFALCSDIIYHEYGHAIANRFYRWRRGTNSGMQNGALNEGQADVWAMALTHDPLIGEGAYVSGSGLIRRYDQTPKVYPRDIRGEVHSDGEIIAGAWWDVAVNTGSVDTMMKLFTRTWYDIPDGPNGMEGAVYYDILISALLNDDDDNDLKNGTPHFDEIVTAFARHGIYLLADAGVVHEETPNQPASTPVTITTEIALAPESLPLFGDISLHYRTRTTGAWDTVVMTPVSVGSMTYTALIPGQPAGNIIDYFFALKDYTGATNVFAPAGYDPGLSADQSNIPYQFGVGLHTRYEMDFEQTATDWKIGENTGDNATEGIWERAVPVASYLNSVMGQLPCQPGYDRTYGDGTGQCLVTANPPAGTAPTNINAADVDNGNTTVITPVFDLEGYENPVISYYRWFSNDRGANGRSDAWQVQIKNGNTSANAWFSSVEHTFQSDHSWRRRIFAVKEYLPQAKSVQLRFIATDRINNSLPNQGQGTVEAALDDFVIYDAGEKTAGVPYVNGAFPMMLYPNPADELVSVVLSGNISAGSISLYDVMGKKLQQTEIRKDVARYVFHTGALAPGSYIIVLQTGKIIQTGKVRVVHR